ncbi:cytochrome c biogenesis protein ResB [Paenibacillus sp. SC116]|uniref:cytochrome c biogenesis protein ResB n=1 Tax=Paenibacillus sp. SC116 TaxID=2968986 RepID=UPI00215A2E4A|nr:cytochrome c biogenesis protein ResB [Paenibacillus sp. SC116]MCR8843004.1 cytochrome c biogenesis protein ResB [Paenibacillus sp. SC116]
MEFQNTKCECGHQNPTQTILCEACGKPLHESDRETSVLEMRYDGVARKSQKANPSVIDRVWNFFSSVKIAVVIIIITLIGASLGTIYPQESQFINFDPSTYYKENYGTIGHIYYLLGLSHTYESWWFVTLLVMIGASLVICSLDRVLPLYRALHKQKIRKHDQFLRRQRIVYEQQLPESMNQEDWIQKAQKALKRKGYRVYEQDGAILAEKNRFSRWGPYINHIGLIVFLLAVLARSIPGWNLEYYAAFPHNEPRPIENTPYYLENDKFTVEYYTLDEMPEEFAKEGRVIPKLFETQATLYRCVANCEDPLAEPQLEEVHKHNIRVNEPLRYEDLMIFQYDFDLTPKLVAVKPVLKNTKTNEVYGSFELKINKSEPKYIVGPYTLELREKYMDFDLGEDGKPITKTPNPNAPAFLFMITGPGLEETGEPYFYFPLQKDKQRFREDVLNQEIMKKIQIDVQSMADVTIQESLSYLNVRIEKALPYIWVGAGISMIGLVMGFYWQHRRIWLRFNGKQLLLGAHTNKNWYGMRNEVARILRETELEVDVNAIDRGGDKS